MKGPAEVTLTKPPPTRGAWGWWRDDDYIVDGDVAVLRIGRALAVVDTTFSESDGVTKRWLAEATAEARGRRLRAPLVALRGHDPAAVEDRHYWRSAHPGFSPSDPANPIRCVALCLGGSRVLVYGPDAHGSWTRKLERGAGGGRLQFYGNNMNQLRAFLDDKRTTMACFGARETAEKLATEWGLHVACPAELTDLFARAHGKEVGVDAEKTKPKKPAKYWMEKAGGKAEREDYVYDSDDEEQELSNPGTKRAPKVMRGPSLERVVLGPEMRLARWPAKVANADWGGSDLGEEEWLHATRDAYLCFEIAARCLQKLGVPIGA